MHHQNFIENRFLPLRIILCISLLLMVTSSGALAMSAPPLNTDKSQPAKPTLVIFSGITMVKPLQVLATAFEKTHPVKIEIHQGASGFLLDTIQRERSGDIYFPGNPSYRIQAEKDGIISDYERVGYNRIALVVAKGNPKHLTNDLHQLINPNLSVVLSSPQSGAIGSAGDRILRQQGIVNQVYKNVTYFTTDSHRLFHAIRSGDADVVINWYAVTKWPDTRDYLTAIKLDPSIAKPLALDLCLLNSSNHPELAQEFIDFAASREGVRVFYDYGFFTDEEYQQRLTEIDQGAHHD